MEKIINLKYEGHAVSPEIKELHLESETNGVGCYKVIGKWPKHGDIEEHEYLLVSYDAKTNDIHSIDFDGGPYLTVGSIIKNKYTVSGFSHNGNFGNIKIFLKECNS